MRIEDGGTLEEDANQGGGGGMGMREGESERKEGKRVRVIDFLSPFGFSESELATFVPVKVNPKSASRHQKTQSITS